MIKILKLFTTAEEKKYLHQILFILNLFDLVD